MQITRIAIVTGLLGLAGLGLNAAEPKVVNSIQGRAGIHTVIRFETEKPTIALSKAGKGVGDAKSEKDQKNPAKARWHNSSRPTINVTAHN